MGNVLQPKKKVNNLNKDYSKKKQPRLRMTETDYFANRILTNITK